MLKLNNVTTGYSNNAVLKDVSVSFEKGKLTSLIGKNGCGKTTLLKAILNMVPLNNGEILIDNALLNNMTRKEIAKKIAYLAQGKTVPDMTVAQMVLHGRFPHLNYPRRYTKQDIEIAFSAMEQVGITDFAHKAINTLSGGMRQNAYIAMALAQDTDYILLDEPTTFLDISNQLELMKIMQRLADKGKGIVSVMHDLPMAFTFSDRIVILNDGKIVNDDEPKNVCAQKTIEEIFNLSIELSSDGRTYNYSYFSEL
ncbi:MAG: ABC transporter ATP-binding protein [Christensenellaceae bacterium]|nr:ABC transporter ATP-binding protein [Christensenellaceae bacterium]